MEPRQPRNFREWAWNLSPGSWRRFWGSRFIQAIGLVFDTIAEGAQHAIYASSLAHPEFANDALLPLSIERNLPRFPSESESTWGARLRNAWNLWRQSGTDGGLKALFAAAGLPGVEIYTPREWPTVQPVGWWSQFWLFMPPGSHPVTSPGQPIGTFTVGDGTTIGPIGITATELAALRTSIRNFKSGHWVCRALIFQITGWTVGDGTNVGEPGLQVGGDSAVIGVH